MRPSRRQILQAAAALTLARCGRGSLSPEPSSAFPLGVASGDPTPEGALMWTQYLGERPFGVVVWRGDPELAEEVFSAPVQPGEGGYALIEATGLEPFTRYSFAFFEITGDERGDRSRVGQLKTALAESSEEPLRIGATCCTNQNRPMSVLAKAAERTDLDLFLLLGDTAYVDGAVDLNGYRRAWASSLGLDAQRSFRAAHSLVATWDDHEFENNWSGETIRPERFAAGARAFFDHQPVRRRPGHPNQVWRSVRLGKTAELFVLDGRGERKPSTRNGPNAEYLSKAQLNWLKVGLAESPAVFKIILNSVPIAEYPGALFGTFVDDRWEGYPAQRAEILRHIEEAKVNGVLWVAGDFHLASMGRVSLSGPGQSAIEVMVGPGSSAANPSPTYPTLPQFDWASGINNYAELALDPKTREAKISFHDAADRVIASRVYGFPR